MSHRRLPHSLACQPIRRAARARRHLVAPSLVAQVARRTSIGLDVYAQRGPEQELTKEDDLAFEAAEIDLCGGILSGTADSFRGKVYPGLAERKFFKVCVERGLGLVGWS